jgi:threonyl-tRNA synthetase
MRILLLHCDSFAYAPIKKEGKVAEAAEDGPQSFEDVLVSFITVEKEDRDGVIGGAVSEIRKVVGELKAKRVLLYPYSHLSNELSEPSEALRLVQAVHKQLSETGLEVHRSPFGWNKSFEVKVKGHPLAEQFKVIRAGVDLVEKEKVSAAIKAEERLKSTWYILQTDGQLVPVDKFDFKKYPNLEKLKSYEIAKARAVSEIPPHVTLMKKLGLVDYEPASDSGNLRYYPKGRLIKSLLELYVTQRVKEYGGVEVETPIMYDMEHPALKSYLNRFPARQYTLRSDDKDYFLRFSACFGQFLIAKDFPLSYKQLPVKLYELTRYSFRREKSGELVGLRRLRAFTMPDCHALCADLGQAKEEFLKRFDLSRSVLEEIGFDDADWEMAIRFTKEFYEQNREFIVELIGKLGRPALVEMWEQRFFYFILKYEFNFIDRLSKASALSTDQIDVENAERYGITYVTTDGSKKYPIILHNSPSGAIERCMYGLLERAQRLADEGKVPYLPVWLSPIQVRLIPFSEKYQEECEHLSDWLAQQHIRADIDDRGDTVQKRVREAETEWIPYIVVLGEREVSSGQLAVRVRVQKHVKNITKEALAEEVNSKMQGKPYLPRPSNRLVSLRSPIEA